MSDTLRTDAELLRILNDDEIDLNIEVDRMADFARQLERELAASQAGQAKWQACRGGKTMSQPAPPEPCRATCRLDYSIFAILCLYEAAELTEGQAVKLMNCVGRVEFRLLREKLHRNFRVALAADMQAHGWQWQPAKKPAASLDEPPGPA